MIEYRFKLRGFEWFPRTTKAENPEDAAIQAAHMTGAYNGTVLVQPVAGGPIKVYKLYTAVRLIENAADDGGE